MTTTRRTLITTGAALGLAAALPTASATQAAATELHSTAEATYPYGIFFVEDDQGDMVHGGFVEIGVHADGGTTVTVRPSSEDGPIIITSRSPAEATLLRDLLDALGSTSEISDKELRARRQARIAALVERHGAS